MRSSGIVSGSSGLWSPELCCAQRVPSQEWVRERLARSIPDPEPPLAAPGCLLCCFHQPVVTQHSVLFLGGPPSQLSTARPQGCSLHLHSSGVCLLSTWELPQSLDSEGFFCLRADGPDGEGPLRLFLARLLLTFLPAFL